MNWRCIGDVLEMYWRCIGDVLEMYWRYDMGKSDEAVTNSCHNFSISGAQGLAKNAVELRTQRNRPFCALSLVR